MRTSGPWVADGRHVKTEDGHLVATAVTEADARLLAEADEMLELLNDLKEVIQPHRVEVINRINVRVASGNTTARKIR